MHLFYYLRHISESSTSVVGHYDEVSNGETGESFIRLVPSMSMNLLYLYHSGFLHLYHKFSQLTRKTTHS